MKIIPVADKSLLREHGIFFSPNTLHKWHSQKVYPEIFIKLNGRLFINLDEWKKILDRKIAEQKREAEKINRLKGLK